MLVVLLSVALWICMAMIGATLIIRGFEGMTEDEYAETVSLEKDVQYPLTYILFLLFWPLLYPILVVFIIVDRLKKSKSSM